MRRERERYLSTNVELTAADEKLKLCEIKLHNCRHATAIAAEQCHDNKDIKFKCKKYFISLHCILSRYATLFLMTGSKILHIMQLFSFCEIFRIDLNN